MASKEIAKKDSLVAVVASKAVQGRILVIRNRQVMLDEDLAELYRVETKDLTRAVRRNKDRFPDDFMFQLTKEEFASLRLQTGASKEGRGGRRYPPFVFTEQGVAMLSSVLRSKRAVAVNIEIMRAFVEIRRAAANFKEIEKRLEELQKKTDGKLAEHEKHLLAIYKALKELSAPLPPKPKHPIGFSPPEDDDSPAAPIR
jgi:phage regulator Rha-like protein